MESHRQSPSLAAAALVAAIGLGAFLLFQIEFVAAKWLLPWFGGTASVWTTCMLFFQTGLLVGYVWAHRLATDLPPRRQTRWHLGLLALACAVLIAAGLAWPSPVTPGASWRPHPGADPIGSLLFLLGLSVGLPFVVLSATGPLLQSWYTRLVPHASPWPLYALSNLGSLLGVLLYPVLLEPLLPVTAQGRLWSIAFGVYALCVAAAAFAQERSLEPPPLPTAEERGEGRGGRASWWALSISTSLGLLAVTNQLTLDVAVVPFLWMLPLVIYLGTFIWAFSAPGRLGGARWGVLLVAASLAAAIVLSRGNGIRLSWQVLTWLAFLFFLCAFGHGELARRRPEAARLTSFYLVIAAGGALGALVAAIVAPLFFRGIWELPISLYAGLFLPVLGFVERGSGTLTASPRRRRGAFAAAGLFLFASALFLSFTLQERRPGVLVAERNFYGTFQVVRAPVWMIPPEQARHLLHGRTIHGLQFERDRMSLLPTTYYGPQSGVGRAFLNHPARAARRPMRVGLVGLGVGTLAAWGMPGDVFRFYELDPAVVALSRLPDPLFTFLSRSRARVEVAEGDARLSLEREGPQGYDLLILDAFSSDAIPVHLLTLEAFDVYLRHLHGPDSVIAVHLSNNNLLLAPVVRAAAERHGLLMSEIVDHGALAGTLASDWALLSRDPAFLAQPGIRDAASPLPPASRKPWTDDYSNLLLALRALGPYLAAR